MENYPNIDSYAETKYKENTALNRKVGADSSVLLKNDAILPIRPDNVKKIDVIGWDAKKPNLYKDMRCVDGTLVLGWDSSTTEVKYIIDPTHDSKGRTEKDSIEVVSYTENDGEGVAAVAKDTDLAIVFV